VPLVDPWSLPATKQREITVTVTDREQPGVKIPLRLRQLTIPESLAAQSDAEELIAEFVDGVDGEAPNLYPAPAAFKPSRHLFINVCQLAAMEVPGEGGQRYGVHGLLGIAVKMPGGWNKLTRAATKLNKNINSPDDRDEEGNSPGKAAASTSSARPSASANHIPA
jgi:hypothetical protein